MPGHPAVVVPFAVCHRAAMRTVVSGLLVVAALALLAVPAHAAADAHGRGPGARATMLEATAPDDGRAPVQVLDQLCENATHVRRCTPMARSLRTALDRAIDRPVTWVSARRPRGPEFWVFEPVDLRGLDGTSTMTWRDPGRFACFGGTTLTWRFAHGTWTATGGLGWAACPAGA